MGKKIQVDAKKYRDVINGYDARIKQQSEYIDQMKNRLMETKGAEMIATILLKRMGEPQTITKEELETVDVSEVEVIERDGGGVVARISVKG